MKYYKVMYNNRVIDVLDQLVYLKYQPKHDLMVLCDEAEAQAIMSSGKDMIWHVKGFYNIPVDRYDSVELVEVDEYEYKELSMLRLRTVQEIIDDVVLEMLEMKML